jgi:hypothetical protein
MNDYNSQRNPLTLKEYGRNIQKLVNYIKSIDDRDKRTQYAYTLVDLMKQINPGSKDTQENYQKIWDDLFIIADFELDVDHPYPIPDKETLTRKPDRVRYQTGAVKFKNYGRNFQLLVEEADKMEDPEDQEKAVIYLGRLMKSLNTMWNKENIDDKTVIENLKSISRGRLDIDLDKVREHNLFDPFVKERPNKGNNQKRRGSNQNRRRRN